MHYSIEIMHLINASNVQFKRGIHVDKYATKTYDYKCFNTHNKGQRLRPGMGQLISSDGMGQLELPHLKK